METSHRTKRAPWPALTLTLFVILVSPVTLWGNPRQPPTIQPGDTLTVATVTINEKSAPYNYIFVGERRYTVSPSAAILDHRGRTMPLWALPVPCGARISYRQYGDHRAPFVEKIQLR